MKKGFRFKTFNPTASLLWERHLVAMLSRTTAILALAGSAAAFSPMMSMETGRRQVVQAAGAAAAAAPLLRPNVAEASNFRPGFPGVAPVITIFDHRGCTSHSNDEYQGAPAAKGKDAKGKPIPNDGEDEMCVKLKTQRIAPNENFAAAVLQETISVIASEYK